MNFLASWIQPDYRYPSVYEIDYGLLDERGIHVLFFDLDQTLVTPGEYWEPSLKLKMLFQKLKDQHFTCLIITNRNKGFLLNRLSEHLGIPIICSCFKPLPWLLKNFIENDLKGQYEKIAVVGDRLFSDILLAKNLGVSSVWVHSLKSVRDWYHLLLKPVEDAYERQRLPQGQTP